MQRSKNKFSMSTKYNALIDANFEEDEIEEHLRNERIYLKNANFTDAQIDKKQGTLTLDTALLTDDEPHLLDFDKESLVPPNENREEEIKQLEIQIKKYDKRQEDARKVDNEFVKQKNDEINANANEEPSLLDSQGAPNIDPDPFGVLAEFEKGMKKKVAKEEQELDKRKVYLIHTNYRPPVSDNITPDDKEKQNLSDFSAYLVAVLSNSVNKYHDKDGDRSGLLMLTSAQLQQLKEAYISPGNIKHLIHVPEWLKQKDAASITAYHQFLMMHSWLVSDNVPSEVKERILKGDKSALRDVALILDPDVDMTRVDDIIERWKTGNHSEGSGELALWSKGNTDIGNILKNFLGGYGERSMFDQAYDRSVAGAVQFYNRLRLKNLKDIKNPSEAMIREIAKRVATGDKTKSFTQTFIDSYFDTTTKHDRDAEIFAMMDYNNQGHKKQFFTDVFTFLIDMPIYALSAVADYYLKFLKLTSAARLGWSSAAHGTAFALPSLIKNSLFDAMADGKVDTWGNFVEHMLTAKNMKEAGKHFAVGASLRSVSPMFYKNHYFNNPVLKDKALSGTAIRERTPFTRADDLAAAEHMKRIIDNAWRPSADFLSTPYGPLYVSANPLHRALASFSHLTVGIGSLNPLILEGRLPEGNDYLHAAAFGAALGVAHGAGRIFGFNLDLFRDKSKQYSRIIDVEGVVKDSTNRITLYEGRMPPIYHVTEYAIKNTLKQKHKVHLINPPKYKPNETALQSMGYDKYRIKDIKHFNGIPVATVYDARYNKLRSMLLGDLAKDSKYQSLFKIAPDGQTLLKNDKQEMEIDDALFGSPIERSKDFIAEDEILIEPETTYKESIYTPLGPGKYTRERVKVRKYKGRQELKRKTLVQNQAPNIALTARWQYPLINDYIYNLNPRFVEERGSSVYNIKLLADLWSPHLDYFKTITEDYHKSDFRISTSTINEEGLAQQMVMVEHPIIQFQFKGENQTVSVFEIEGDYYGFDTLALKMLGVYNINPPTNKVSAETYNYQNEKQTLPRGGQAYSRPHLLRFVFKHGVPVGKPTLKPHERGGLVWFNSTGEHVRPLAALKPIDISNVTEKLKTLKPKKKDTRIITGINEFTQPAIDIFNPVEFSGKDKEAIYNKLFVGTGLNIFEMLVMAEQIMEHPVAFDTPATDRHLIEAVGYAMLGPSWTSERPETGFAAPPPKKELRIAFRDELIKDPVQRADFALVLAHELGHLLDFYERNWETMKTSPFAQGYEDIQLQIRKKLPTGTFETLWAGAGQRRTPGLFSEELLEDAGIDVQGLKEDVEQVGYRDAKGKFAEKLGRGNVLGSILSMRGFAKQFFDMESKEAIAGGSARYKELVKKAEDSAKKNEKKIRAAVQNLNDSYRRNTGGLELLDNELEYLHLNETVTALLNRYIPRDLHVQFAQYDPILKEEMILDTINLLPKEALRRLNLGYYYDKDIGPHIGIPEPKRAEDIGPETQVEARMTDEYRQAFVKAFERQFDKRDIISMLIVHREMRYVSNKLRPMHFEDFDKHGVLSDIPGELAERRNQPRLKKDTAYILSGKNKNLLESDLPFANQKLKRKATKEDLAKGMHWGGHAYRKLDPNYILPSMQEFLDYTPAELEAWFYKHEEAGYDPGDILHVLYGPYGIYNYYFTATELFADWMSVFLMYPEQAAVWSPTTTKLFEEFMSKKPILDKQYKSIKRSFANTGDKSGRLMEDINLFERRMKEETDKVTKGIREKDPDEKLPRLKTVAGRLDIKKAFWDEFPLLTSLLDYPQRGQTITERFYDGPVRKGSIWERAGNIDIFKNPKMTKEIDIYWHLRTQHNLQATKLEKLGERLTPVLDRVRVAAHEYGYEDPLNRFGTILFLKMLAQGTQRDSDVINPYLIKAKKDFNLEGLSKDQKETMERLLSNEFYAEDAEALLQKKEPLLDLAAEEWFDVIREYVLDALKWSAYADMKTLERINNNKYVAVAYADKILEQLERNGQLDYWGDGLKMGTKKGSPGMIMNPIVPTLHRIIILEGAATRNKILNLLANPLDLDARAYAKALKDKGLYTPQDDLVPFETELWHGSKGWLWENIEILEAYMPGLAGGSSGKINYKIVNGEKRPRANKQLEGRIIRELTEDDWSYPEKITKKIKAIEKQIAVMKEEATHDSRSSFKRHEIALKKLKKELFFLKRDNRIAIKAPKHMMYVNYTVFANKKMKVKNWKEDILDMRQETVDTSILDPSGKTQEVHMYINKYLVEAFYSKNSAIGNNVLIRTWSSLNKLFKNFYTGYNVKFGWNNAHRDPVDIAVKTGVPLFNILNKETVTEVQNLYKTTMLKLVPGLKQKTFKTKEDLLAYEKKWGLKEVPKDKQSLVYTKHIINSYRPALTMVRNPEALEGLDAEFDKRIFMLPKREIGRAYEIMETESDQMLNALLRQLSIEEGDNYFLDKEKYNAKHVAPVVNEVLTSVYATVKTTEISPRSGFYKFIKEREELTGIKIPDKMLDMEIAHVVTPFYAAYGTQSKYLELMSPFIMATLNAWRSSKRSFRDDPWAYATRRLTHSSLNIILTAISVGLFGDELADMIYGIDEHDKVTKYVIPLFTVNEGKDQRTFSVTFAKPHEQIVFDETMRAAMLAVLHLGGVDVSREIAMTDKRAEMVLKILGVSHAITLKAIGDSLKYFLMGKFPVNEFIGGIEASEDMQVDSEGFLLNPDGFKKRVKYFVTYLKSMSNDVGLMSPLGLRFDVGQENKIQTKDHAYNEIAKMFPVVGDIFKTTFNLSNTLGEKQILMTEKRIKDGANELKLKVNEVIKKINDNDGYVPTEEETLILTLYRNRVNDKKFMELVCNINELPSCSRLDLMLHRMSPARRHWYETQIFKKIKGETGKSTKDELDAARRHRESLNSAWDKAHRDKHKKKGKKDKVGQDKKK